MRDVLDLQRELLNGDLYKTVCETENCLRSPSEYDIGTSSERQMAILCYILQEYMRAGRSPSDTFRKLLAVAP